MSDTIFLPGHHVDEATDGAFADLAVAQAFNKLLKAIDPCLKLAWVPENAASFENPGRWHIVRENPHNPEFNTYWVVQTPDGRYCEPQEMHLERLKAMDTFAGKRMDLEIANARSERKKRAAQRMEDARREFRETLAERLDHIYDARIAISPAMKDRAMAPTPKALLGPDGKPVKNKTTV